MRKLLLLPFLLALSVPAQANFWDSIMNQEENQEESKIPPEDPAVTPPPPLEATVKALPGEALPGEALPGEAPTGE